MEADTLRLEMVRQKMQETGMDAMLCRLPHNVLMLTGYAPVLGNSFVLFPLEGNPVLIVPKSEEEMARQGWVTDVRPFETTTLRHIGTVAEAVEPMLAQIAREKRLLNASVGFEHEYGMVPASYSQFGVTSPGTTQLFQECFGDAEWKPADEHLEELQAVLTPREIEVVRTANLIAAEAMHSAKNVIRSGLRECDVAGFATKAALAMGHRLETVGRVLAFPHILSGPRAEHAFQPFGLTTGREIETGDTVLVQLEVYVDGLWAEITRTFLVEKPSAVQRDAYEACLEAMERARAAERAGVSGSEVDRAARITLTRRGYGDAFRHGLGHGVGFQAISHERQPRLHPASLDILRSGMIHNIEPAVYMSGFGIRINDDILVTDSGTEQLTPLETDLDWAICDGATLQRVA